MFFSTFVGAASTLGRLCHACPKVYHLGKTLAPLRSTLLPAATQCRGMSERKGFEWLTKDLDEMEEGAQNRIHAAGKYTVFKDDDADIILDVDEERALKAQGFKPKEKQRSKPETDEFAGINLERGEEGVYDIEDLVHVLKLHNAQSIFVASLPEELQYANHIVVVTGKSKRHMDALATFVRRVYKKKVLSKGPIPHIEGVTSNDWLALDLGNIILHIMSTKARVFYDLECLWAVGPQHDSKLNDPDDPMVTLLEEHSVNLADFQPLLPTRSSKDPGTRQPPL